ncbi:DUF742 domain-containing protein [Streptomyces sp. NPDC059853]|uniref:DUF742 domain-containing protein n=1 Tax=Streptomyces sp. NPDC059853 TaxID=3346973 RepID=UPI00365F4B89
MPEPLPEPWLDDDAGALVRPFTASGGRTRPAARLDLLTLVLATGADVRGPAVPEHDQLLALCRGPVSVAELAAHIRLPVTITKVLLSDLLERGAVTTRAPGHQSQQPTDKDLLEAVLHGLRKRL